MSIFNKDNDLTDKLGAAQAEITEHEATIQKRETEAVKLTEDLTAANEKNVEHEASIVDLTAKLEASDASVTSITAELEESKGNQEDFDSKVNVSALAKVAELGLSAPVEGNNDSDNTSEMSREAFGKLSPSDKSNFAKSGGRIK